MEEMLSNPWLLLVGLIASSLGMGAFIYGKRSEDYKAALVGAVMMGATYFVGSVFWLSFLTVALTLVLFSNPILNWIQRRGMGPVEDLTLDKPAVGGRRPAQPPGPSGGPRRPRSG